MDEDLFSEINFQTLVLIFVFIISLYRLLKYCFPNDNGNQVSSQRRGLSTFEQFFDELCQQRQGSTNIGVIMTLKSRLTLGENDVRIALVLLARRQPMLRAIVRKTAGKSEDTYFEIMNASEVYKVINLSRLNVEACQWQSAWLDIVAPSRRNGTLLWNAVLLQETFLNETGEYINTIIVRFCHCAFDGVSAAKFCQLFIPLLNEVASGQRTVNDEVVSLPLLPAADDLVQLSGGLKMWRMFMRTPILGNLIKWAREWTTSSTSAEKCQNNPFFNQFPPDQDSFQNYAASHNKIIYKIFESDEIKQLVKECRNNKSTVTGALVVASHLAFCELLQGSITEKEESLRYAYAINFQQDCGLQQQDEYLGSFLMFSSGHLMCIEDNTHLTNDHFWNLAQHVTQQLHNGRNHLTQNVVKRGVFKTGKEIMAGLTPGTFMNLLQMPNSNFVSSIGSFSFDEANHIYKLDECILVSLSHGVDQSVFSHYNVTVNGKMSWLILYNSCYVSPAQGEHFGNLCFSYLDKIIAQ